MIEHERSRLAVLYDVNRRLANAADWEEVVDLLVHAPGEIVDAAGCVFLSFDERSGRLTFEGSMGVSEEDQLALQRRLQESPDDTLCADCRPLTARVGSACPLLLRRLTDASDIDSILCLRLTQAEHTVGYLNVYLSSSAQPSASEVQLLNAIAAEMGVVVAAAQLRAREMAVLSSMDQAIRRQKDHLRTLEQLLSGAREAHRMAYGVLFLCARETTTLTPIAAQGVDADQVNALRTPAQHAIDLGDPYHRSEPATPERQPTPERNGRTAAIADPPYSHPAVPAVVAVPLMLEQDPVGALVLADDRPQNFSQRQITLLSIIASQAALVLRNTQLYTQLEGQTILEERARLAREIHDGLAQGLSYLGLTTEQALRHLQRGQLEAAETTLTEMVTTIQQLYAEVRKEISSLRTPLEAGRPFLADLATCIDSISRRTHVPIQLRGGHSAVEMSPAVAVQALRIVQEGLNNAVQHAGADQVEVQIQEDAPGLHVIIQDNGSGFDPAAPAPSVSHGLQIMRERTALIGGDLDIHSNPQSGTVLTLYLPRDVLQG